MSREIGAGVFPCKDGGHDDGVHLDYAAEATA
jgi:hypothetical protein